MMIQRKEPAQRNQPGPRPVLQTSVYMNDYIQHRQQIGDPVAQADPQYHQQQQQQQQPPAGGAPPQQPHPGPMFQQHRPGSAASS